jgi:serine/threonine protein kinase
MRTIGQGGMGAVYKAQDMKRRTFCAIKEMSLSMVPPPERAQAVQNFLTEAQMLSSLKHPNLPSVTGYFTEGPRHFLVMEYIEGMTLDEYLSRNNAPFSEARVLGWAKQLCDVLSYLHSQHPTIIFRDMKPGNIMVMRDNRVKLIDFGIARFFRHTGSQDTQLLGTPGYAPPEQYGKAQTDERSDIYSLAMTLFQLMTNTLSEKGFGLNDIHSTYPEISLPVARTLEKATALAPEGRFQSIEAFRRVLFSDNTFLFENGDQATTAQELAELCARYSDEAAAYIFNGEIETWLNKIGNANLARKTREISAVHSDPEEAVNEFLQAVLGPNVHIRTGSIIIKRSRTGIPVVPPSIHNQTTEYHMRLPANGVPDIIVEPLTLDFGEVYPGLSEPLLLTITDERGIHGTIATHEPWIQIDETSFDGVSTQINVRVNTLRLRGSMHHSGSIIVMPDEDDEEQDIAVAVEVDVLGGVAGVATYPDLNKNGWNGGTTKGQAASDVYLDGENDGDVVISSASGMSMSMAPPQNNAVSLSPKNKAHYEEYKTKYGEPSGGGNRAARNGWEPMQATPSQLRWMQRGLTIFASLMLSSLFYSVLSQMPFLNHQSPLSPNPWFSVVLMGIVPAATLGTLVVNWSRAWGTRDTLNRTCTGLSIALLAVSFSELVWQLLMHANAPVLQLFVMLLAAALGSAAGVNQRVSDRMIDGVYWSLGRARWLIFAAGVAIGGILGAMLTIGFALSPFTFFGILVGSAIGLALVTRIDQLHAG